MIATKHQSIEALLLAIQDTDTQQVCDAARALALLGDSSVVPRLRDSRDSFRTEWATDDRLLDASEERRDMALTMAIISLLPTEECRDLLQTGDEFERYLVRRKQTAASLEEFWGPL